MEEETFAIEFSEAIPAEDRQSLLVALRTYADVHESRMKRFDADWILVIGVLKDCATIAGAVGAVANLATTLIKWRRDLADKGVAIQASIKVENAPKIDLESASDEELKAALKARQTAWVAPLLNLKSYIRQTAGQAIGLLKN